MFAESWKAIAARIDGVARAAALEAQLRVNTSDTFGTLKVLGRTCAEILQQMLEFRTDFADSLPSTVCAAIEKFENDHGTLVGNAKDDRETARAAIALLAGLRSEVDFLLADRQETIRSRTERAFLHLRQVLAANPRERALWRQAFDDGGEAACEKLGAVHLLWHGIFPFKTDARGGRTDLVFAEPLDANEVARGVDGLVLTEWKVADANSAGAKFATARRQADLYKSGVLGGLELSGTRYLVAVTIEPLDRSALPSDMTHEGVLYRHLNIAVEPGTPSRSARERR
jgi:hypothetical protein